MSHDMNNTTLADYGIDTDGRTGRGVRILCPECQHLHRNNEKTLSVDTERGLWQCFRCDWKGSVKYGGSELHIYTRHLKKSNTYAKPAIERVVSQAIHISESPEALEYLLGRLGELPDPLPKLGAVASHGYYDSDTGQHLGNYTAMLGAIRTVSGGLMSLHRTYIKNGKKAPVYSPKKIMTPIVEGGTKGCAVQLYKPTDELIIAEGIETALAMFVSTGIPAWSTISAHGMETVGIPEQVRKLTIAADNDENGTGQKAAEALSLRYRNIETKIIIPPTVGTDWLDVMLEAE
jgi:putative DNA primase/helicase